MRHLCLPALLLLALAACSPTTDITRASTEPTAERTPYRVIRTQPNDGTLRLRVKVYSPSVARTVAEDLAIRKWHAYDRIEVDLLRWDDAQQASPFAVLRWSTKNGFSYSENR